MPHTIIVPVLDVIAEPGVVIAGSRLNVLDAHLDGATVDFTQLTHQRRLLLPATTHNCVQLD